MMKVKQKKPLDDLHVYMKFILEKLRKIIKKLIKLVNEKKF